MIFLYLSVLDTDDERSKFEKLYDEHKNTLFNVAYKILNDVQLAEDAVHEAFISLAKNMDKIIDRNCIQIRNYLIIIVKNAALRIYNKRKKEVCVEDLSDVMLDLNSVEINVDNKCIQEKLFEMIKDLDYKYADVLILKYFYDMSNKEIAAALGISLENVKIRLIRGKNMLKKNMEAVNFYDESTI